MAELSEAGAEAFSLNMKAFKALVGGSDTPEADIAALLRSDHTIEPEIRAMIADALAGRSDGIELRAKGLAKSKLYRSYQARKINVRRAQRVFSLQDNGATYDDAVAQVANEASMTESTIQANVTLAKKMLDWCAGVPRDLPAYANLHNSDLELVFLYADVAHKDPLSVLDNALKILLDCEGFSQAVHVVARSP